MSAGSFLRTRYEADNGEIYPIRIQPETAQATLGSGANNAPAAAATQSVSARVGGGNRQLGLKARSVTVEFTGTPPTGYAPNQSLRIPVLTPAVYNAISPNSTVGSYLGADIIVIGKNPERIR